jgi:hypothetical protein
MQRADHPPPRYCCRGGRGGQEGAGGGGGRGGEGRGGVARVARAGDRAEELSVYRRALSQLSQLSRADRSSNYSAAFPILPPLHQPSPARPGGGEGRRRGRTDEGVGRGRGGITEPLSYRNGVARSQPFNELGQLTLYAPSFPAFRFYVNFNSLRRAPAGRKSRVHR